MTTERTLNMGSQDARLVRESLAGNREAFGQIVARYQSLICSLAYSATGSLSQSEDLAQETFLTAWVQLPALREPASLRSWLCGIARGLIGKVLRQRQREPSHAAQPLQTAIEFSAGEPLPSDLTMSREEAAILWRSVGRLPISYREPLVLFYREHQSVTEVAAALELSEDAVKQRLSRGRKLLHEAVLAFVEDALARTKPGKTFTTGVLAAIPWMGSGTSAAATVPAGGLTGSVKVLGASTGAAWLGPLSSWLAVALGILGGMVAAWGDARNIASRRERVLVGRMAGGVGLLTLLWAAALGALFRFGPEGLPPAAIVSLIVLLLASFYLLNLWFNQCRCRLQVDAGTGGENAAAWTPFGNPAARGFKARVYGLFAAAVFAPVAWMTLVAQERDPVLVAVVFVLSGALFAGSSRWVVRLPQQAMRVLRLTLAGLFLGMFALFNLRWPVWVNPEALPLAPDLQRWVFNLLLALLWAFVMIVWAVKRNAPNRDAAGR